jgi:protein SCO1
MSRAGTILFAVGLLALPELVMAAAPSSIPSSEFGDFAFRQNLGAALPLDTRLRDAKGAPVALRDLFGKRPVVLDFEYDRCTTLCGVVLDQLAANLRGTSLVPGRDFEVALIDIDPAATPAEASDFARQHGTAGPGVQVLTGEEASIRAITDVAGFPYRRDAATGQFAHPAGVIVATPEGKIARYLQGLDWRALDLRLALTEAAGEGIAAPAEQLLLFCYCYDPQTGRYDLAIARLLEVIGAATVLALGGLVWLSARGVAA